MADKILEALNKLVEKSGGDPSDNKLIVDAINDLVETGGGGGGSATIVTLTFNRNPSDPSMWAATGDKTYEDLKPIMENGGAIISRGDFNGDGTSVSKSAYGYEVSADSVNLQIRGGLGEVMFYARTGEELYGTTV